MSRTRSLAIAAFVLFVPFFGTSMVSGAIAGMERDANVYGGLAEAVLPLGLIATAVTAAAGITLLILSAHRSAANGPIV